MTTIVNTPSQGGDNGGNLVSMVVGAVLLLAVVFMFLYFGLPMLRRSTAVPQVNVPENIDINVTTPSE